MNYANITTHEIVDVLPSIIQTPSGVTHNPTWDQLATIGWRKVTEIQQPSEGCRVVEYGVIEIDGTNCRLTVVKEVNIAEEEKARRSTPIKYDQPIQARIEVPANDGHIYGVEVDPACGMVIPIQRESNHLPEKEYQQAKAAKLAQLKQLRDAGKAGISGQLQQRIENIERYLGWRP